MDSIYIKIAACAVFAYLLGNISPSIILGKMYNIDIKKEGSGNAGTTNALRVLGKKAALITLVIDIGKGFLAVSASAAFAGYYAAAAASVAVFCGHIWPCFYSFKGGKGVATAFGALLAVNWQLALIELAIVAAGLIISKKMSVGSILGAACFPVVCKLLEPGFTVFGVAIALVIIFKHRANIGRLMKGEEPNMSFKSKK